MKSSPSYWWRRVRSRRETRQIRVGSVLVGGGAPISVQSMTNTSTEDVSATVDQVRQLQAAGADVVRVSCPSPESTRALSRIIKAVGPAVPIIADIHFHYRRAIEAVEAGAACVRINPGNIGSRERVAEVIRALRDHGVSMRLGVNTGSLDKGVLERFGGPCPEGVVASVMEHVKLLQDLDFHDFKISAKSSDLFLTVRSYEALADRVDYPLHLGITEAGGLRAGSVRSSMGVGYLLYQGVGDTVRVSLSAHPVEEVKVGFDILKALGLRQRGVTIISCPSCARQGFDVIETVRLLEERVAHVRAPITVSIIGCVVNGPGEASNADIGFTGGGAGSGMLYLNGRELHKLENGRLLDRIVEMIEQKALEWARAGAPRDELEHGGGGPGAPGERTV